MLFVRDFAGICPEPCAGILPDKSPAHLIEPKILFTMNSIAQELVSSDKIKVRLKILISRVIEINYFWRNASIYLLTKLN